jgi:hypothetical protein
VAPLLREESVRTDAMRESLLIVAKLATLPPFSHSASLDKWKTSGGFSTEARLYTFNRCCSELLWNFSAVSMGPNAGQEGSLRYGEKMTPRCLSTTVR